MKNKEVKQGGTTYGSRSTAAVDIGTDEMEALVVVVMVRCRVVVFCVSELRI